MNIKSLKRVLVVYGITLKAQINNDHNQQINQHDHNQRQVIYLS
jgi:hypothetical protein